MIQAMPKKYGGNSLGEKPRSDSSGEIILDAEEITERVMQNMGFGETKKGIRLEFFNRITEEEQPKGNDK